MGPLAALTQAYNRRLGWTLALPHLGIDGCARHGVDAASLPDANLNEINSQTKDPHVLCVEVASTDGALSLVPLLSPCTPWRGSQMARELVRIGVHPLDIVIATLDLETINRRELRRDTPPRWTFRNAVEWMFWTSRDQMRLDAEAHQ